MNIFLLIGIPYLSVILLIIGSYYKYRSLKNNSKFSVENIEIFKEIPLFHAGLGIIILAHIIGFLVPSSVLAWNGQHMRLLIIEIGAFGLALASLLSLIVFAVRQIKSSNNLSQPVSKVFMNVTVFALLIIIIISGLWIANLYRWGSSWYAGVMTPYLRSFFKFSPDISAVQYMPIFVKIHIIFAFLIIGLFPFTSLFSYVINSINYLSIKKQIDYFSASGLLGAGIISVLLALYFGSSYEEKKADHKINLMTADNKIIIFENKEQKVAMNSADSTSQKRDSIAVTGKKGD